MTWDRSCYSLHLYTFQRKLQGCSRLPPAGAGGMCPMRAGGMEKVRPLPESPSCYDCLWVPCLLGCLSLCFNKCCFNARICGLVNDNVPTLPIATTLSPIPSWSTFSSPRQCFPNPPGTVPLLIHFHSLIPAQPSLVQSGLDHSSSSHHDLLLPAPTHPQQPKVSPPNHSHPLRPGSN